MPLLTTLCDPGCWVIAGATQCGATVNATGVVRDVAALVARVQCERRGAEERTNGDRGSRRVRDRRAVLHPLQRDRSRTADDRRKSDRVAGDELAAGGRYDDLGSVATRDEDRDRVAERPRRRSRSSTSPSTRRSDDGEPITDVAGADRMRRVAARSGEPLIRSVVLARARGRGQRRRLPLEDRRRRGGRGSQKTGGQPFTVTIGRVAVDRRAGVRHAHPVARRRRAD